jgi:cyanophycin synthetase
MRIKDTSVFVGPNLYALFRVIRMTVDLGPLEAWPSGRLGPTFQDALVEALPGLRQHGCSYGEEGGFLRRLTEDEGTWLGHVFEHVALELQNAAGADVTFGRTRDAGEPGLYTVVFEYEQEDVGLEAGKLALQLLCSLLPPELVPERSVEDDFVFSDALEEFIRFAQRRALGPSTAALVKAAEEREIPYLRLNEYSLVQLGHGRLQRRIQATVTSETRHIAVEIASDKEETNKILADLGLPVARQHLVYTERSALRAASRIGFPLVVKPLNANHGRGVSTDLKTSEEVRVAFEAARKHSRGVLVESFITGFDHRMLVVNGALVAVAQRVPGHVVGDGSSTVAELVERANEDPRRGIGHEKVLTMLEFDHQAERLLEQNGFTKESVPAAGEIVWLRTTGNLSTGGTATDLTDQVHPDNRQMAIRAAQAIGLDVAGVDFLTSDISRSWTETGGAICEVNAAPGFRMHVAPSEGEPRDVAGAVMDMLFPPGSPSRIPIAAVTGTNGKTTTVRMLAHIFKMARHTVGLATTDGVYIDGKLTVKGDMTGPVSARMVLRDPTVDVAVLETARGGLLKRGMGTRRCNVGAVLNVQADHLGLRGVDTLEDLAKVKRIVVETARDTAVLNADDPLCLKMAAYTEAESLCYVTANPRHPLVREHIRAGGCAVVLEEGIHGHRIDLHQHNAHMPLLWTFQIPATLDGKALHNVQNAMFAAAIAHSMGVSLEDIRQGLLTFDTTYFQAPGRMNIYDEHPFKVVLDYGHNPAAVRAMVDLTARMDVNGKRLVVLAAPGDRRDEDIFEIASIAAGSFDQYICRRDDSLRGREPDEVPRMLKEGLLAGGVLSEQVLTIADEAEAVRTVLEVAGPDDLVLIFGDDIDRTWRQITTFDSGSGVQATRGAVPAAPPPRPVPAAPSSSFDFSGDDFVRDERGVHLARDVEEGD